MTKPKQNKRKRVEFQKTFRATPELLKQLEARAMMETACLGINVSCSDIVRRGLEHVLAQPLPRAHNFRTCNPVPTAAGTTLCLTCKMESTYGDAIICPQDSEAITS